MDGNFFVTMGRCLFLFFVYIYFQIRTLCIISNIISSLSSSSSSSRLTKRPLSPLELINFYSKINWILEGGGGSGESSALPLLIKTRKAEENRKSRLTREAAHSKYNYNSTTAAAV